MYVYTGRKLALWLANFHSSAFRCSSGTQQYLVRTLSINKYVTSLFFRPFEQPHYIQCYIHSFDLLFVIVREIVIYMQIMQIVCLFDSSFECPRNKMLSHINKCMHTHTANLRTLNIRFILKTNLLHLTDILESFKPIQMFPPQMKQTTILPGQ